jgi:hypothetical protein
MKVQKSIKLAHTSSVLVSVVLNALLILALLTFITFQEGSDREISTVMVIDATDQEEIDEIEEEIVPEEVVDPDELDELVDFTLDTPMETEFETETEVVDQVETDVSSLSELMSDVSSPVVMSGLLVGRTSKARQAALSRYGQGMGKFSEPAVLKALEWLRDNQGSNGSWGKNGKSGGNSGYTGLALLTFLAHGETPASADFGSTVARGIRFLVENQDARGIFRPAGAHTSYGHAMGTYALAEAFTMTGNILLKEPLERGVKVIIDGQMDNGGYDYDYKQENRNDLSLSAWHVQALKAARIALPDHPDIKKYLNSAMDGMVAGSKIDSDGGRGFTYSMTNNDGGGARHIVTAAGGLTLYLSGRGDSREARQTIDYLERFTDSDTLPTWGVPDPQNAYGGLINLWYYAIQAFFQENPAGKNFKRYMPAMVRALVQNQAADGHWLCYTERGAGQGPTYNTTLAALGLMVYYRYLPTTQAENIQPSNAPQIDQVEEEEEIGFEI